PPALSTLSLHDALPIFPADVAINIDSLHAGQSLPMPSGFVLGAHAFTLSAADGTLEPRAPLTLTYEVDPLDLASANGDVTRLHRSEEHTSELQSPCNLV